MENNINLFPTFEEFKESLNEASNKKWTKFGAEFMKGKSRKLVDMIKKSMSWAEEVGIDVTGIEEISKDETGIYLDYGNFSDLSIDLSNGKIKLFDKEIQDSKSFKKVWDARKKNESDSSLDEAKIEYDVEYYDPTDGFKWTETFKTLKEAIKSAEALKKRSEKELGKYFWYIGVSSLGDDFAIIYVFDKYLSKTVNIDMFNSETAFQNWKKAAEECLKTKKTVIGKYEN